jgi:quercetin dioxygenase-like cupin family protein
MEGNLLTSKNLASLTKKNDYYRKILYTDDNMQLVLMCLKDDESVPEELHDKITQFIRIESGECEVTFNNIKHKLNDDSFIIIPANTKHTITKKAGSIVQFYTIYSPPGHKDKKNYERQPKENDSPKKMTIRRFKSSKKKFDFNKKMYKMLNK